MDGYKNTSWHNPTEHTLKFKLYQGLSIGSKPFREVVVGPGETIQLDSQFDDGVKKWNKDGVLVGGNAPQLVKDTEPEFHKLVSTKKTEIVSQSPVKK